MLCLRFSRSAFLAAFLSTSPAFISWSESDLAILIACYSSIAVILAGAVNSWYGRGRRLEYSAHDQKAFGKGPARAMPFAQIAVALRTLVKSSRCISQWGASRHGGNVVPQSLSWMLFLLA
jgi:hypothetical protein